MLLQYASGSASNLALAVGELGLSMFCNGFGATKLITCVTFFLAQSCFRLGDEFAGDRQCSFPTEPSLS